MAATACGGLLLERPPGLGSRATWRRRQLRKAQLAGLRRQVCELLGDCPGYTPEEEKGAEPQYEDETHKERIFVKIGAHSDTEEKGAEPQPEEETHTERIFDASTYCCWLEGLPGNPDSIDAYWADFSGAVAAAAARASSVVSSLGAAAPAVRPSSGLADNFEFEAKEYFDTNQDGKPEEESKNPMTAAEGRQFSDYEEDDEDDEGEEEDIIYVCEKMLANLQDTLNEAEEVTWDMVNELPFPENIADEEILVPVDMRGVLQDFDNVEQMAEKLGPREVAETFLQAKEYFDANQEGKPEEERKKSMTAAEWRQFFDDDDDDEVDEEELYFEDEDEEEVNPLDLVYDIMVVLSRRGACNDGWVDMASVVSMAGKWHTIERVQEAVESWEDLSVLIRDKEKTLVKFLTPP